MNILKFGTVHGAFLIIRRKNISLSTIDSGDKESIDYVSEEICNAVKSENFKNIDLQRLFLLLYLNTNTEAYKILEKDERYYPLVGYIPMISKHILAKLIFSLKLLPFLYNSIIFIDGELCHELQNISEICLQMLDEFEAIDFVENVLKALYKKLAFTEDGHMETFLYAFIKHYNEPSEVRQMAMAKWNKTKLYHFSGLILDSLLLLLYEFVEFFCKSNYDKPKSGGIFELFDYVEENSKTMNLKDKGCVNRNFLLDCCNKLISVCLKNMTAVTIDVYMYWVEIDLDDIPDTENTLQKKIRENAFKCNTILIEAQKMKIFSTQISELIQSLSAIASNPHVHQQAEEDLPAIIQNIRNNEHNPTRWLEKLLVRPFELTEDIVKLLNKNIIFLDQNSRQELFTKGVEFANNSTSCPEFVKELVLNIVNQGKLDCQIKFLEDFVKEYGLKKMLMLNNFKELCTETFNKVVIEETKCKELFSNFISLAMQDGETVIECAVNQATSSEVQGKLMTDILYLLSSVCFVTATTDKNGSNLLSASVRAMYTKVLKMPVTSQINFSLFVTELVKKNLLDGSSLISDFLLPYMSTSTTSGDSVETVVHSVCVDSITMLFKIGTKVNNSHVLATLIDVLHESRCTNFYISDKMTVCEKTISLIDLLVADCIENTNNFSDKDWLKDKTQHHNEINKGYLARLFPEDNTAPNELRERLFYMMHRETVEAQWNLLELDHVRKRNISVAFNSTLFNLTRSEWKKIFCVFAPDNARFIELFKIISDSFFMLEAITQSFGDSKIYQDSLAYVQLTAGYILNQMMCTWNDIDVKGTSEVFLRFCSMIKTFRYTKQADVSMVVINILIAMLKIICVKRPVDDRTKELLTAGIFSLDVPNVRKEVGKAFVELMLEGS